MTCEEAPEAKLWLVGVFMSIAASTCTNLGVNMQKYSFIREAKQKIDLKRSYLVQPYWVSGLLLVIFGSLGDFAALGFAPQTLVTPVGGFTMVANVIFAHFFLKEAFAKRDAVATMLIIGGVITVAAFADKGSKCYTLQELIGLYGETSFIVYMVLVVCACSYLYYSALRIEHIYKKNGPSSMAYKKVAKFHPVIYPALSGVFGAQSVLLAKSTAELIKITFTGENQFTQFGTYLITIGMFACIFLQIHWLAKGLQYFDAVFVVPVFQCFFISTSIIGGGVYFDEFSSMETTKILMFFIGVAITLFGVVILSQRDMTKLKPIGQLRSKVHAIIFIKRIQKAIHHDYHWYAPAVLKEEKDHLKSKKRNSAMVQPLTTSLNPLATATQTTAALAVQYAMEEGRDSPRNSEVMDRPLLESIRKTDM